MPKSYTELYYHFIWATKNREPFIMPGFEDRLYRYIVSRCSEYGYKCFKVNGIENHVHAVLRLPPTVSVAEAMQRLKGSSSHFVNNEIIPEFRFVWQTGYGALTFARRDLKAVVNYVAAQKDRHRDNNLNPLLESCGEDED